MKAVGITGLLCVFSVLALWPAQVSAQDILQNAVQIDSGGHHTCALLADGSVECWGWNSLGELGDGKTTNRRAKPQTVVGLTSGVTSISAGWHFTCAVLVDGRVQCWGDRLHGKLGNNNEPNGSVPVDVIGISDAVAVTTGLYHACALTISGGVKCWGANYYGQVGDGTLTNRPTAVDVSGLTSGVTAINAGGDHSCAILNGGNIKCWGRNYAGQLGNGDVTEADSPLPVDVNGLTGATALALGNDSSCALTISGGVKCWGHNFQGKLGDGTWPSSTGDATKRFIPVDVVGLTNNAVAISSQANHSCALLIDETLQCWGYNDSLQLGFVTPLGYSNSAGTVTNVTGSIQSVAVGDSHTCVILTSGNIRCWGRNLEGQLGIGTTGDNTLTADDVVVGDPMPETAITDAPNNPSGERFGTFSFSGSGGSGTISFHLCQLDNGDMSACSNSYSYSGLPYGPHTFRVSAVDSLRSVDATPVVYTWEIAPPVTANNDFVTVNEDALIVIDVLANDRALNGAFEPSMLWINSDPLHGTATVDATTGAISYQGAANYYGSDSLIYFACDINGDCDDATVSITISPVNDPPVVVEQTLSTNEDQLLNIVLAGTDIELDPLTFVIDTAPQNGTISGIAPNLSYVPAANYYGADSFTFKANDGQADSNIATVTIDIQSVNDTPVADNDSYTTNQMTAISVDAASGVIVNDSDIDGDSLNASLISDVANGTLLLEPNGAFSYTPLDNFSGIDTFTYVVNDGQANSNVATVTIEVVFVNQPPVANDQSVTTDEDQAVSVVLSGTDVDGDPLQYSVTMAPSHGTLSGDAPNLLYTPAANFSGSDAIVFKVNDGTADSNLATVTITVNPVNDAPVATAQSVSIQEDQSISVILSGTDVDGDPLLYNVTTPPSHGTLSGDLPNLLYTPDANFNGTDAFVFIVNDGTVDSATATISLSITPVNDVPTAIVLSAATIEENQPVDTLIGGLTTVDADAGDAHTYSLVGGDTAAFSIVGNELRSAISFDFESQSNYDITVRADDGNGGQLDSSFIVTILDVNEALLDPTITIVLAATPQDRQNFRFSGSGSIGNFSLDDSSPEDGDPFTNSQTFTVIPGSYPIQANIPRRWQLVNITCTPDTNATVQLDITQVTLAVDYNDTVTCTFHVSK